MKKLILMMLVLSLPAFAVRTHGKKHHKSHQPSWFEYRVFPPTADSLLQQNAVIDELHLPRITDKHQLLSLVDEEMLVPITQNSYVRVNPQLEPYRRYCKPWVNIFLQDLGQEYYTEFGEPIQVNSAVRTIKTQIRLLRWNRNAAPIHGEKASAHLAGVAVDLQRRGLSQAQVKFIQEKLLLLAGLNKVIVEEELRYPCFHIVVTGEYLPPAPVELPILLDLEEVPL